ncbi:type III-A CRISPR-associated RAMP protein Csm3 [candidate division KSB1 bacterium]|nr:type III-A CRISPR-associated RAMP protein Csm3 [candidate division KSB1 bacterium]
MAHIFGILGNIVIQGTIEAETGLHIGASADTVEIGGIDSPVIKHPKTGAPYIPGSSLKGKMRSFMEKITAANDKNFRFNRNSGSGGNKILQHVCDDLNESYLDSNSESSGAIKCPVCRVYGSTGGKTKERRGDNLPARIVVRDCSLVDKEKVMQDNLYLFEAKMENAIDRITAAASPRTFERVPAGAFFKFEIVYKVIADFANDKLDKDEERVKKDIKNIFQVLSLIEKDGLGGSVSRGYGKVVFNVFEFDHFKVDGKTDTFLPDKSKTPYTIETLRQSSLGELKIQNKERDRNEISG